jgi:hypothetical protein
MAILIRNKALIIKKQPIKEAVEHCVNMTVAGPMKGTQLVMTLNRSVWSLQSSTQVSSSSVMIDGNIYRDISNNFNYKIKEKIKYVYYYYYYYYYYY